MVALRRTAEIQTAEGKAHARANSREISRRLQGGNKTGQPSDNLRRAGTGRWRGISGDINDSGPNQGCSQHGPLRCRAWTCCLDDFCARERVPYQRRHGTDSARSLASRRCPAASKAVLSRSASDHHLDILVQLWTIRTEFDHSCDKVSGGILRSCRGRPTREASDAS